MSGTSVNLFWTGGWDSTYRLLDLVLVQERQVQPYYLIDTSGRRPSFGMEIETMRNLRDELASDLIAPTIFRDVGDVAENRAITAKWEGLRARQHLGWQYDFLARFAEEEGIEGLEVSIESAGLVRNHIKDHVELVADGYVVRADADADVGLFAAFRFPLLETSKLEMQEEAERHGFAGLLEQTWFCDNPRGRLPCGICGPCRHTREKGLGRRIPPTGHSRYYWTRFKAWLRHTPAGEPLAAVMSPWRRAAKRRR